MAENIGELPNWVGYKAVPKMKNGEPVLKPNGKPKMDKVPMNPHTGGKAQVNNPATWGTFETTVGAVQENGWDGVGFVLTKKAGVVGIDLDDCIDENGQVSPYAENVTQRILSYAEKSPSNDGIHILAKGSIPRAFKNGRIELYDDGRFLTYTGNCLPGFEGVGIRPAQDAIDAITAELEAEREQKKKPNKTVNTVKTAVSLDYYELIEKAKSAANGAKFQALWEGNTTGYESQSEADAALCQMLAFWTGNDETAVDSLFRQSGLYREKWDEVHYSDGATYGQRTIERAIAQNGEVYSGNGETAVSQIPSQDYGIPSLPDSAYIDPALGKDACQWLDDYVAFSRRMSPRSYDGFHEAGGLWVLSTIAARRVTMQWGLKTYFTNLYICLCALTTIFAKTTVAKVAKDVIRQAGLAYLLAPDESTPQAFINMLSGQVPGNFAEMSFEEQEKVQRRLMFAAQKGWFYEEFGTKLQGMMRESGIMADFRGHLRVFDDNPSRYEYVAIKRQDVVERPYLAMLATMTPADIQPYAKPNGALWRDGFLARWTFVTPPIEEKPKNGRFPTTAVPIPSALIEPLQKWHERLGLPTIQIQELIDEKGKGIGSFEIHREEANPAVCRCSEDVTNAYYAYLDGLTAIAHEQAERGQADLVGNYGRFPEKAMRIAMLLASLSNNDRIELRHWARAQTITEKWRVNLHNLAGQMQQVFPSEESKRQEQIIRHLQKHPSSTAAEISRSIRGLSGPEVETFCEQLVKANVLQVSEKTQRETNRYTLADE